AVARRGLPARGPHLLGDDHRVRPGDPGGHARKGRGAAERRRAVRPPLHCPRLRAAVPLKSLMKRFLGVPFLYAAASSAVGFSVVFWGGVAAERGLGLTPLLLPAGGLMCAAPSLSYVEGGAMLREGGGSSAFARHAFNELISFIAGWAILIDY